VKSDLIFDSPKLQSLKLRFASTTLTFLFWVVWFYLWIPIVTLVGWWFQVETMQHEMVTLGGFQAFLDALPGFLFVTACLTGTLTVWALYNFIRFKGQDRRKPLPTVQKEDLLSTFSISEADLLQATTNKISTISIDENDKITVTST